MKGLLYVYLAEIAPAADFCWEAFGD